MTDNYELFHPVNTGAPRFDLYHHLTSLPATDRLDFEAHTIAGDLIIRFEPDLGGGAEDDTRILALPYALRFFGALDDATEFIRCVKLIAGEDARPYNLQLIAAHYYQEARTRPAAEVLKEMALLGLQLTAVTATQDERLYGVPSETEVVSPPSASAPGSGRTAFLARAARWLDDPDETETDLFAAECRAVARRYRQAAGGVYDEFAAYLAEQEEACADLDEIDALYASFEAVYEQYDEGRVVSLQMSGDERVVVAGRLDDDIDETHLPDEVRPLAAEMHRLYTDGFPLRDNGPQAGREGVVLDTYRTDRQTGERYPAPVLVYGLDEWLHHALESVYHERTLRTVRHLLCVPRPAAPPRPLTRSAVLAAGHDRQVVCTTVTVPATFLHEQTATVQVCPDAATRDRARRLLETLLARWQRDFQTRAQHRNPVYRDLAARLQSAHDTADLARLKQEAWQRKEARQLSVKQFTALLTRAGVQQATLADQPWRVTRATEHGPRAFLPAQPLLRWLPTLTGGTLPSFALALHTLPRQEQERVRVAFREANEPLYQRVRQGLQAALKQATAGKLRYFRWACYGDNKPEHPFHTLTQADRAEAWELLKALSARAPGTAPPQPPPPVLPGWTPPHAGSGRGR